MKGVRSVCGRRKLTVTKNPIQQYRVLGRPMPGIVAIWEYGIHCDAEAAIRRLKKLTSMTGEEAIRQLRNARIVKANPDAYIPKDTKYVDYWIERYPSGVNMTRELLAEFVHNPANKRKKKTIAWAVEETLRPETHVIDTGWRKSGNGSASSRSIPGRITRRAK